MYRRPSAARCAACYVLLALCCLMYCRPSAIQCPAIHVRVPVLQSISCNPCPAIHVLRSVSVFLSCDPFPAIHVCVHVLQSVSSNPCPAIRVLPTMSCPSCPAVPVLPSMSCQPCLPSMFCHPCPAKTQHACPIRRLSSLLLADSLFTGWVGGFNFTLIEFPETFCGRHIEDTVKAVCVHAARNFPKSRLCLCDFKEPVCREIFMLRDCTLPDVRN